MSDVQSLILTCALKAVFVLHEDQRDMSWSFYIIFTFLNPLSNLSWVISSITCILLFYLQCLVDQCVVSRWSFAFEKWFSFLFTHHYIPYFSSRRSYICGQRTTSLMDSVEHIEKKLYSPFHWNLLFGWWATKNWHNNRK